MKLVGTVRAIKKMTQNDNGPSPGQNYGKTAAFTFVRKVFFFGWFWLKMHFNPKNTQNFLRDWYLFGKRDFFLWTTFSGRGQNMVRVKKWAFFFWFLAEKSDICHTTPMVDGPFVALGETVHFPPLERFSDFRFPSYSRFCKKKTWLTRQKVFPLPTHCGGTVCQ